MKLHRLFGVLALSFITHAALAAGASGSAGAAGTSPKAAWEIKDQCDVPSYSLKTLKSVTQDECQQGCEGEKDCKGFVYVTGWKRCLLKGDMKKQAKLRFVSGELSDKRTFDAASLKLDHDHSGKDLERQVINRAEDCGKACEANGDCQAFTYLDGYHVCWLKAKGGALTEKVFRCGIKK